MALRQILVGKNGCNAAGLTLIQGDANTQIIQMIVQRYYGGVDLGGLTWDVVFENAEGKSDVQYLTDIKVGDVNISCNWKPHGLATQAAGMTKFQLEGYAEDNSGATAMVWQSGAYYFNVTDDMNHVPGEGENEAITDVHKLIMYVDKELPGVVQAGKDAAAAAAAANAAAAEANKATAQAVPAAEAANTAATSATNAAGSANTAATRANTAAEGAEVARDNIQADLNSLKERMPVVGNDPESHYMLEQSDIDDTLSVAGKVADAKVVGEKIGELSKEIGNIDYSSVTNLINPLEFVADSYWAGYGNTASAAGYASISIPVKAGVSYSCSGQIDKNYSWFHAPGIEHYALTSSGATIDYGTSGVFCRMKNFVPEHDGIIRITSRNTYVDAICLVNDEDIPTIYSEYGVVRTRKLGDQIVGNAVEYTVVVAKDGSGDYTTIKEAAAFAKDHANTTIIVEAGTYDIIEEMGADYFDAFTSSTSENSGIILTNGVHLIFRSNAFVVCNYTGGNDYVKEKFSPFVVDKGQHTGFIIENMHLSASNVRYCVHDDTGAQKTPYRNVYRNCHMYIDNTANTAWTAEACIGGGTGCATEILIENCYFDCGVTGGWNPKVVNYHNCETTYSPCRSNIVVKDCYFAGVTTCGCSHYGEHTETSRMIVCGCSMAIAPSMRFENSTVYPNENFELIAWNNEIRG